MDECIIKASTFFLFTVAEKAEKAEPEPGAGFDSRGLSLRAQKKLVSKMGKKNIVSSLIDETSAKVLDNIHKTLKLYKSNKKEADKILKYMIKTTLKVNIYFLYI